MKTIEELIPWRLRWAAKAALRPYWLRRGVDAISRLEAGKQPTRAMLQTLRDGWGNFEYAASIDYLEEVAKNAAATEGPILECGSGLTTLLLGMLAGRRGVEVRSLEHSPEWQQRICAVLKQRRITNVDVLCSPLRDYGDFSWYDPPLEKLPDDFRLVVCDGPPGGTKGGRYGLMPILGARLGAGAVILLDDAGRPGEAEIIDRWQQRVGLTVEVSKRPTGTFATLVKRS